jgi:hypothetical protein
VHRPQSGVFAGIQRGRLFPHGAFRLTPGRAVLDLDGGEARGVEVVAEPDLAEPLGYSLVVRVERFPAGQRDAPARRQDPAQLGERRVAAELDRVHAEHGVGAAVFQSGVGHVGDAVIGVLSQDPGERPGADQRLLGKVDTGERGPGTAGDLQAVRAPAAGQVEQPIPRFQRERGHDLRQRVPRQQAVGDHRRGHSQVPAHDLVADGEPGAVRVPFVEALGGHATQGTVAAKGTGVSPLPN